MPPRRHVTLRDVAQEAGVSVRTVSNVVNDFHYVSDSTRVKVEAAIARLGYRPNRSARSLRSGSTHALGLVLPALSQPYYAELADAVFETAREHGYKILIETLGPDGNDTLPEVVGDLAVSTDGILLSPAALDSAPLDLTADTAPMVALTARRTDTGLDHVTMDDAHGAQIATAHLIDQGRRYIAVVGCAPDFARAALTGISRYDGYERAHDAAGLTCDTSLAIGADDWTEAAGYECVQTLLDQGKNFDAVFAMNDLLAVGVLHGLQVRGLRVPADVAVVGFDDIAMATHLSPPLTTVDPGMREIVRTATDLLLERIEGTRTGDGEERLVAPTLRIRASTVDPS